MDGHREPFWIHLHQQEWCGQPCILLSRYIFWVSSERVCWIFSLSLTVCSGPLEWPCGRLCPEEGIHILVSPTMRFWNCWSAGIASNRGTVTVNCECFPYVSIQQEMNYQALSRRKQMLLENECCSDASSVSRLIPAEQRLLVYNLRTTTLRVHLDFFLMAMY